MKKESNILSKTTISNFKKIFRNICLESYLLTCKKIGGLNKTVEIDKSLIYHRKYNRGRSRQQLWVVGGICREDKKAFMMVVANRSTDEIRKVIQLWVDQETQIIYTDFWRAYNNAVLVIPNAIHKKNNHDESFVEGSTHTQNIEKFWGGFKLWIKKNNYNKWKKENFIEYLGEFFYKRENLIDIKNFIIDMNAYLLNN